MTITTGQLLFCLSGGPGASTPATSLGGTKSTTTISDATLNNLFDDVAAAEASTGDVEYRGIFVMNTSTETLSSAKFWLSASTTAPGDEWYFAGDGVTQPNTANSMSVIADESTAPTPSGSWLSFSQTLSLGDLTPTKSFGIWIKRSVSVGAASYANNSASLAFLGETA